ncbi:MAG: hypothetical protein NVSMB56_01840 [Pyrinomonadaceae bacterium]
MKTTKKRPTKKDDSEIERLRRLIRENEERLQADKTSKGNPLTATQRTTLHTIIETQRGKLNEILSRLDDTEDKAG